MAYVLQIHVVDDEQNQDTYYLKEQGWVTKDLDEAEILSGDDEDDFVDIVYSYNEDIVEALKEEGWQVKEYVLCELCLKPVSGAGADDEDINAFVFYHYDR